MCVHACLLTCLSLYVQIAEAFKLPFLKRNTSNLNGLLAESELVDLHTNSAASTTPKILFREFKRQQQQSTNFFSSRIISSYVSYSEGEDIFLFVCLVVCFCVMYFCVCLSFLSCFMCYRLSYLLSQEVFRMSAYFL